MITEWIVIGGIIVWLCWFASGGRTTFLGNLALVAYVAAIVWVVADALTY